MEKSNDESSENETIIETKPVKSDGRKKERTEKQKQAFALMAERRKVLNDNKSNTKKVVPKQKKKVIEKQPDSDSSSSEEEQRPVKSKSKRPSTTYNYFYGPQTTPQKLERFTSQEAPVLLPTTPIVQPVPSKPEVKKSHGIVFV